MRQRLFRLLGVAATGAAISFAMHTVSGQSSTTTGDPAPPAKTYSPPMTPWGEPDLEGIWSRVTDTPLQRPTRYGSREFFTDAERAELDRQIADIVSRDTTEDRRERGTGGDVNAEFAQSAFTLHLPVGNRTSLIVDPPNGRLPPFTPEAQNARNVMRQFQLALLQPTEACKKQMRGCAGGKYGPVSPRRNETPPMYISGGIVDGINRADGPEERGLSERCLTAAVPEFGSAVNSAIKRIVQSPGQVSMYYEGTVGQGWPRNIPITTAPHLPSAVRQWHGDSRGRWEGTALVVDVTNFSPKSEFQGSHQNLHLIERWTRLDADTLEYAVTVEDPTTWTGSWTAKMELKKQDEAANRIYYEPRCQEGNAGLAGILAGARAAEKAFARGRGPDPATLCSSFAGCGGFDFGFADEGADANPLR